MSWHVNMKTVASLESLFTLLCREQLEGTSIVPAPSAKSLWFCDSGERAQLTCKVTACDTCTNNFYCYVG